MWTPFCACSARDSGSCSTLCVGAERLCVPTNTLTAPFWSPLQRPDPEGGGKRYTLLLDRVVSQLRERALDHIVQQRFGSKGLRLWRLLQQDKYLEAEQASKRALMPEAIARMLLHRLSQDGFVHVQEVPKRPDYAPTSTYFLYMVVWTHTLPCTHKHAHTHDVPGTHTASASYSPPPAAPAADEGAGDGHAGRHDAALDAAAAVGRGAAHGTWAALPRVHRPRCSLTRA